MEVIKMVRTVNEAPCTDCGVITNYYDPNMGRLCPKCTAQRCASFGKSLVPEFLGTTTKESDNMQYLADSNKHLLTDPLIDHSEDIESSATAYHISNIIWEEWLENVRSKISVKQLLEIRKILYAVALETAKVFSLPSYRPQLTVLNKGARKECAHFAECVAQSDWKKSRKSNCSLKSCSHICEFYVDSYTIWG